MRNNPADEAGFTLVELLISLFLAMTLMLIVAETARQLSRTYSAITTDIEAAQNTRRTLAWLARISRSNHHGVETTDQSLTAPIGTALQLSLSSETGTLIGRQDRNVTLDIPLGPEGGHHFETDGYTLLVLPESAGPPGFATPLDRTIAWDCRFDPIARRCQ